MSALILKVENLQVSYGRFVAVRNVSIAVPRGGAVAIIGPNGAGKSTTLSAIAGGIKDVTGVIELDGSAILRERAEKIALRGLSLVPEGRHMFASLSVRENLLIGSYMRSDPGRAATDLEKILTYFPRLRERLTQAAGQLSGGEQQMLAIGRALMTNPRILMVDEPSLGLAPKIIDEVYEILLALRQDEGLALLINEQNSKRVLKFMDQIYVLRVGVIQMEGKCADLRAGTAVSDAYFGHGAFGIQNSTLGEK